MFARACHRHSAIRALGRMLRWELPAAILAAVLMVALAWSQRVQPKAPPKTRMDNVTEVLHGVELVDPYRWLEDRSEEHTSELQSRGHLVCRLLLEKKKNTK